MHKAWVLFLAVAAYVAIEGGGQDFDVPDAGRHLAQTAFCRGDINLDILGKSIGAEPVETSTGPKCCSLCKKEKKCVAWVWQQRTSECFLKSQATVKRNCFGCMSQVTVEDPEKSAAPTEEIPTDYFEDDDSETDDSGVEFQPLLVGSRPVPANEAAERYPYMVSLRRGSPGLSVHHCGGVLIANQTVLTAAHCVDSRRFPSALSNPLAYIGLAEIDVPMDDTDILRTVAMAIHPNWTGDIQAPGNLALLRLERPSQKIPIQLPFSKKKFNRNDLFNALGWGRASDSSSAQRLLQQIQVKKVGRDVCAEAMGRAIPTGLLCAGGDASGTCIGDDGGPLLLKGDRVEDDILAGIIGAEHACTRLGVPDIYANVPFARSWINDCHDVDGTVEGDICRP